MRCDEQTVVVVVVVVVVVISSSSYIGRESCSNTYSCANSSGSGCTIKYKKKYNIYQKKSKQGPQK